MRAFICIICIILLSACTSKEKPQHIEWLQGKWIRLNDESGRKTFEHWDKSSGLGFTLLGKDTVFKEELEILNRHDRLYLEVEGANSSTVLFKFTSQTDSSFVCENKDNEFPKKIRYLFYNDTLRANVSNDDLSIDFVFVKQ